MSKITAKNLHYDADANLPPFRRRLRGEHAPSSRDGPDPILAAHRRPTKKRSGSEEAEDAPLIVDENGDVISDVQVGLDGTVKESAGSEEKPEGEDTTKDGEEEEEKKEEKPTTANVGIGNLRNNKRKVGKVIGGGADDSDDDGGPKKATKLSNLVKEMEAKERRGQKSTTTTTPSERDETPTATKSKTTDGKKKKAKKIKLSFGDDD